MRVSLAGLSTDTKPTVDIENGSLYHEHDTGETFYFLLGEWTKRKQQVQNYFWDTEDLQWKAAIGTPVIIESVEVGLAANIGNFPAVISGSEVPVSDVNTNPTSGYKASDIDNAGNPEYYGFIKAGGSWYVLRITDGVYLRYCKGDTDYTGNWTNRGISLTYQLFHLVF